MNKSIAINTCPPLSSSADRRKQDKEAGRAIPPSPLLRGGVFSLVLLRHPPVCIASYSPLQPLSRVLSDVRASGCVCARALRPPQFISGKPVSPVRHRAACTHSGTAERSGRTEDTQPPSFPFNTPPPIPFLYPPSPTRPNTLTLYSRA